ncbi:MAG: sigma 54-interacting transcriptional regulator, partial [Nannocystaceae bacterium]|nr:sigma 54-interacting transcriptional regulator [Nannocystaceae bacterium]
MSNLLVAARTRIRAKVLRVLPSGEFMRVGGNKLIEVDGWVLAATHRNLQEQVQLGEFREDLSAGDIDRFRRR